MVEALTGQHSFACSIKRIVDTLQPQLQVQRLLELQSYLNGGVSDWPAPTPEPPIKEEIHVPEPTGNNRPVLNPGPDPDQLFQDVKSETPQPVARAPAATPVSKWTVAQDLDSDKPAMPVSKWVAQEVRTGNKKSCIHAFLLAFLQTLHIITSM